jgi:transposase
MARKPGKVAAAAMANRTARMVWAVLTCTEPYRVRAI